MANDIGTNLPKGTRDQASLAAFVESLIKEKNDPNVTPQSILNVVEVLLGELDDQINTHLVNLLPEEKQKELERLLDNEAQDSELDSFFEKSIPNLESEIAAVLLNFRAGYLAIPKPQSSPVKNVSTELVENLTPAPAFPVNHTPFDSKNSSSNNQSRSDKSWN